MPYLDGLNILALHAVDWPNHKVYRREYHRDTKSETTYSRSGKVDTYGGSSAHCAQVFKIHKTAYRISQAGVGFGLGLPSIGVSSGKCFLIIFHC